MIILLLLSFPWWSVLLAKPLMQRFAQIEVQSVKLDSWKRWDISGLDMEKPAFELKAQAISAPSPTAWILGKVFGNPPSGQLAVKGWTLRIIPGEEPAEPAAPTELTAIFKQAKFAIDLLRSNLESVSATDGLLIQDATELLRIPKATTDANTASLSLVYLPQDLPIEATLDFSQPNEWTIDATSPDIEAQLEIAAADDLQMEGFVNFKGNRIELSATWPEGLAGVLPDTANLSSTAFSLDQRYPFWGENPPLALDLDATWADQQYQFEIQSSDTAADSPRINLAGAGDLQKISVNSAMVDLPWLRVESDAPLVIDFSLENPLEQAQLVARADLGRLPWIEGSGAVRLQLSAETSGQGLPSFNLRLEGDGISVFDTQFESMQAVAHTEGKFLQLESLLATTVQGSSLNASGGFDLEAMAFEDVSASLDLRNESERLRQFIQFNDWSEVNAQISLSGPLQSATVSAQAQASQIGLPVVNPLDIKAEVEGSLDEFAGKLQASSGPNQADLAFSLNRDSERIQTSITSFTIASSTGPTLALNAPATVSFSPGSSALQVEGFSLRSEQGSSLSLRQLNFSRDQLTLKIDASELRPEFFESWLIDAQLPSLYIIDLNTEIALSESQSSLRSSGEVNWSLDKTNTIEASWRATQAIGEERGIKLEHLEIGSAGKHILRANGSVPVTLNWSDSSLHSKLLKDAPFSLDLRSTPHPDFWRSVETLIPVSIKRPTITAQLSGTLMEPQGKLDLQLASLTWKGGEGATQQITLTDLQTSVTGDNGILKVNTLSAKIGQNSISANASLPLKGAPLQEMIEFQKWPNLSDATGQATVEVVDLASLSAWLPTFVRQQGKAVVEAKIESGKINAVATVENLATRPLPPLGAISKVNGSLSYDNGLIRVDKINGLAEQSPFSLGGSVDLSVPNLPRYNLAFKSKEFPLLRDAGLLFTGDIDLSLVSKNSAPPVIGGSVTLTKGLVLIEPEILAGSTKTAQQRPPYFAVEQEPFNNWDLEVAIKGDRFLRVSNAFFDGTLSADFLLDGSLGYPLLIGKAEAANGRIKFPASTLELVNGEAIITRDQPYTIQVEANAEERLFAYDINLNVSGELSDLDITITTNPALTQVEALLLVTTGAVPDTQGNLAQQSATSIGLFLGKGLLRKLSGSSGDAASRLSVEVGSDTSRQDKKTIQATYQLTEDLELEGEYDERDEYNANLKWTFYKR